MWQCVSCGQENLPDDERCVVCGDPKGAFGRELKPSGGLGGAAGIDRRALPPREPAPKPADTGTASPKETTTPPLRPSTSAPSGPIGSPPPPGPPIPVPPTRSEKAKTNLGCLGPFLAIALVIGGVVYFATGPHLPGTSTSTAPGVQISEFPQVVPYRVQPRNGARDVNVRVGPGTQFSSAFKLANGVTVDGTGRAYATDGTPWIAITASGGSKGFIKESLLAAQSQTAAAPTPQIAPPPAQSAPIVPEEAPAAPPTPEAASPSPAVDEASRLRSIITSTQFARDQSPGSGDIPHQRMIFRVDGNYANARPGDVLQGNIVQNGRIISQCAPITLQNQGTFWCRAAVFGSGDYTFVLTINNTAVISQPIGADF